MLQKIKRLFVSKVNIIEANCDKGKVGWGESNPKLKELSNALSLKSSVISKGMEDIAKAAIAENVSLIKSIPPQYFNLITDAVVHSITIGNGLADLVPEIKKYADETLCSAHDIALDQTRKAYNFINRQKLLNNGIKQFYWSHSGGGLHPRESHIAIDGELFSFANLEAEHATLGVPEADRGYPGVPLGCRCTMRPIIIFEDDGD